ncbi:MAG: hypothetical protein ACOCZB_03885 [Spirochaetota bacterium]
MTQIIPDNRMLLHARIDESLRAVAQSFHMDEALRTRFLQKPIARLIAALPFLAGCDRPERTAALHLGAYVLSTQSTRHLFFAVPEDDADVYARLEPIMQFQGGDEGIIGRGMALIAHNMVVDYQRDREIDRALGKYNPVASGAWNAEALIAQLRARIRQIACPEMDEIMTEEDGTEEWWVLD